MGAATAPLLITGSYFLFLLNYIYGGNVVSPDEFLHSEKYLYL